MFGWEPVSRGTLALPNHCPSQTGPRLGEGSDFQQARGPRGRTKKEYPLEKEWLDVVWRKVVSVFIQGITTSLPLAGLRENGVGTCWLSSLVILHQDDAFGGAGLAFAKGNRQALPT